MSARADAAHVTRQRRDRDHRDRRDADAADNHGQRLRKFDADHTLPSRHSQTACGVYLRADRRRVSPAATAARQHELRVDDQRDEDRREARGRSLDEDREQRQARNRVDRAERAEQPWRDARGRRRRRCPAAARRRTRPPARPRPARGARAQARRRAADARANSSRRRAVRACEQVPAVDSSPACTRFATYGVAGSSSSSNGSPTCSMRPSRITTMRSARRNASSHVVRDEERRRAQARVRCARARAAAPRARSRPPRRTARP